MMNKCIMAKRPVDGDNNKKIENDHMHQNDHMHCSSDEILWVKLTPFQETDDTASIEVTQTNTEMKSVETRITEVKIKNVMPPRTAEVKNRSVMPPRSVKMIMA